MTLRVVWPYIAPPTNENVHTTAHNSQTFFFTNNLNALPSKGFLLNQQAALNGIVIFFRHDIYSCGYMAVNGYSKKLVVCLSRHRDSYHLGNASNL
jgi:hypothetical protein